MVEQMPEYRRCTSCGKEYPGTTRYFHRDRKSKDNLRTRCKNCVFESKARAVWKAPIIREGCFAVISDPVHRNWVKGTRIMSCVEFTIAVRKGILEPGLLVEHESGALFTIAILDGHQHIVTYR